MGASHGNSAPCPVWCLWVLWKWRYNLFNFSCDLTRPPHWGVMRIYGWELLAPYHHPDKFCDHRCSDGRDIMFLSCRVRSRESPKDMAWKHTAYHVNKSDIGHKCLKQEQKKKKHKYLLSICPNSRWRRKANANAKIESWPDKFFLIVNARLKVWI